MPPPFDPAVFVAVAHPARRRMLELLRNGDRTVTEIGQLFSATQSATSQHLAVLRRARLVSRRRDGRRQLYRVNPARLRPLIEWVATFDEPGEGQSHRRR